VRVHLTESLQPTITQCGSLVEIKSHAIAIGNQIQETSKHIKILSKMAKEMRLFSNNGQEMAQLSSLINQKLQKMKQQLESVKHAVNNSRQYFNSHLDEHYSLVLSGLQENLMAITREFEKTLHFHTEQLKTQQQRSVQAFGTQTRNSSSLTTYQEIYSEDLDFGEQEEAVALKIYSQPAGSLTNEIERDRAHQVKKIEEMVNGLKEIMSTLAEYVLQQHDDIERIDDNVLRVEENVKKANKQLLIAKDKMMNNRPLIFKIFGVLLAFALIGITLL